MKTGLVLSGGGSTGAYQLGVIKALEELKIKCDIVVGTSIGSINGAMYVSGAIDLAEDMWNNLSFKSIFAEDIKYTSQKDEFDVIKKYVHVATRGGIEPNNLKENLVKCIDINKFYNSKIDYGLTTVSFPRLKSIKLTKSEIKKEELFDYLIASATVYPVFKLKNINNNKYVDGGVRDTIPYDLAIKLGAEKIIIVNTSYFFKNAKIPKRITSKYDITMIKPRNKTGPSLMFETKQARKNIKYGYNDTMKIFHKYYGNKYTFKSIDKDYMKYNIDNEKEYIKILELLGKIFKLDDSRVYTIGEFHKKIMNKFNVIEVKEIKEIKNIKSILDQQERIKFIYNKILLEEKSSLIILKSLLPKEHKLAKYLYEKTYLNIN